MIFYEVRQLDGAFHISAEHITDATTALKKWADLPEDSYEDFDSILRWLGWDGNYNPVTGEVYRIWYDYPFTSEDIDSAWMEAIAPYVDEGSYFDITEHDGGSFWRIYFDGKTCKAYEGELTFPGCPRS